MAYIAEIKGRSYFKRLQTPFRRRAEGKTDYQLRRFLVTQDNTKFGAPKYRFVVRITNRDVVCQVISARLDHDEVLCAAYGHELTAYGIPVGQTNYASCYATGLLLARRLLKQLGIDGVFSGVEEVTGETIEEQDSEKQRPFKAFLDIGLARSTTGARVFAAMKGAVDGGIHIPHKNKRFAGYSKDGEFNPEVLRGRLLGKHVADHMIVLRDEDPEKYKAHFSRYIKAGISPENIEELYLNAHKMIREDPNKKVAKAAKPADAPKHTPIRKAKMSRVDADGQPIARRMLRKEAAQVKKLEYLRRMQGDDEQADE